MNKERIKELIRLFKIKSTSTDKTPVMIFDDADKEIIITALEKELYSTKEVKRNGRNDISEISGKDD